jgi:hypothetical protein
MVSKIHLKSVWVYVAVDAEGNDVPAEGIWARKNRKAAEEACAALNMADSWLRHRGLRARVAGRFMLGASGALARRRT